MSTPPKNIKISILHSDADQAYCDGLRKHLIPLERKYKNVMAWDLRDITFGNTQAQLQNLLRKSDIVLLLLSIDFLSEKLLDEETRLLLDIHSKDRPEERFIMPLIMRAFQWQDAYDDHYDIEKISVFTDPISSHTDPEETYVSIVEVLADYIERISSRAIRIALPTWAGYLNAISYNKGLVKNKESIIYEQYKRTVKIELNDDFESSCESWEAGEVDLIGVTLDSLPHILKKYSHLHPQVIFQASWSEGADAVVARSPISKIADLKGQTVICSKLTPSYSFLKRLLKDNDLEESAITLVHENIKTPDDAIQQFKASPDVSAVVLWSPYVEACLNDVEEATVIADTAKYPNFITDVLVTGQNFLNLNEEELQLLLQGWMEETKRFRADSSIRAKATSILIDGILRPLPALIPNKIKYDLKDILLEYFELALQKIHLCDMEDNLAFFGLKEGTAHKGKELFKLFETEENLSVEQCFNPIIILNQVESLD